MSGLAALLPVALLVLIVGLGVTMNRAQRRRLAPAPGQPLASDDAGGVDVPVIGLILRGGGLGGMSRNSLNPRLRLTPEGLAFKLFRQTVWPYAQLSRVHAGKGLLGATLDIDAGRATLHVTLPDLATARQVLAALPRTVPLTPKAAALRDDGLI